MVSRIVERKITIYALLRFFVKKETKETAPSQLFFLFASFLCQKMLAVFTVLLVSINTNGLPAKQTIQTKPNVAVS